VDSAEGYVLADIGKYLDQLASLAAPAGGWGYVPGQLAHVEPTCLALLALSLGEGDRYRSVLEQGRQALERCAEPDGTYRLDRGREQAFWPTALVLFVQCALGDDPDRVQRTASRLLALRGRVPDDARASEHHDIDHRLVGWPWAEGNFSWAEPTAWACLALERAGCGGHARVAEGKRLLLDRVTDEGGINYGNRRIFDRTTEPQVEPTALMLLALQSQPREPRIQSSIRFLAHRALQTEDLEQLCWIKLPLSIYAQDSEVPVCCRDLDERILSAYQSRGQTSWIRPAPMREALTALALSAQERNPFLLAAKVVLAKPVEAPAATRSLSFGQRLKVAFRGFLLEGAAKMRPLPASTQVHIASVSDYNSDLVDVLKRQYASFREKVPLAGKRIVLKPNLVEYHRGRVINTNPHVVAAVIELCRAEGAAEVIVAEGPGHCRNVEHLVRASGLGDVLSHYKVSFTDLNHDEPAKMLNLGRLTGLDNLYLARTITSADVVISLPKLKTHHWAGATLSLKNLFGTLPGICYGWPKNELHWRGIDNSIVDIALTRTPDLAIVDGIIGMEGDGPLNGTPKSLGALIMGSDLLAVDATCCRLMQLNPERIGYLVLGSRKKLGLFKESQIEQIGERIDSLAKPFETLPHLRELYLRRPA
jgi:uncharacterized protein (DUF362 family)